MLKRTPLYDLHVALGGKIVPFAGYELPVQYGTGLIKEHMAVREKAGLFDVSHMGELRLKGPDAAAALDYLLTNKMSDMPVGRVRYSPMCNERGGIVDDMVAYRFAEDDFLLVVNAANKDKDFEWIKAHVSGDVKVTDESADFSQLALQGPLAREILSTLTDAVLPEKPYQFVPNMTVAGIDCLVSTTGYTGEDGFELYTAPDKATALMKALLAAGEDKGLIPCGLGARDTLRLEASMPLYGHEMSDDITPLEAGLSFFVKMDKPDFVGKAALLEKGEPTRKRVGLKVDGRGIVREESPLLLDSQQVGVVTSGTLLPYTNQAMAMALVDDVALAKSERFVALVRGREIPVVVAPMPFYKRKRV